MILTQNYLTLVVKHAFNIELPKFSVADGTELDGEQIFGLLSKDEIIFVEVAAACPNADTRYIILNFQVSLH